MRRYHGSRLLLIAFTLSLVSLPVQAQGLVTSLSEHLVSITSSFTGDNILVFGAVGEIDDPSMSPFEKYDVAIVVRGPVEPVAVWQKGRIAGIWVNQESVTFRNVPGFYAVATTSPLREMANANLLSRHQLGLDYLDFARAPADERKQDTPVHQAKERQLDDLAAAPFQAALIRNRQREALYLQEESAINFLGERLFRWTVSLPATVPVGNYKVEVYLLRGGQIVAAQFSPLFVYKAGLERRIYGFAYDWPLLYGIAAVLIALSAGWLANAIFREE
ncbi:MAG TPA: hypothetical protein DCO73_13180 [Alphaproteobacteria bacterium]|nr:hypothetical protein [Alphaproteobacteria bacterium]